MGQWYDVPVDDSLMRCYLTKPQAVNGPGVLVCMHGPGVDEFIQNICERLASSGFVAIAPDLYHRQPEPRFEPWTKIEDTQALHDMAKAINALKDLSETDPERVGYVGVAFHSCIKRTEISPV
jgi:carboxymethylenebutenolidase